MWRLEEIGFEVMERLNVLFLGTENACPSQIAEGLVNHDLGEKVKAFSAVMNSYYIPQLICAIH
jgi:protein-tyrosine-phosphatase